MCDCCELLVRSTLILLELGFSFGLIGDTDEKKEEETVDVGGGTPIESCNGWRNGADTVLK